MTSQPKEIVMDPFYSYATRFVTWDGLIDANSLGANNPISRAIVVAEPRTERHIEFNVRVDAISAVSPYIKTMFNIYPTKRRLGIESATADDMQILLKYMHTGIYNPTDISHRHRNKHDIVFRHIDFYLFCQKLGYTSLMDVVGTGIQGSLDVMTWSPLPSLGDRAPSSKSLLMSMFSACESYYPRIKQGDPIKKSLLIYSYHLWKKLGYGRSIYPPSTKYNSDLWKDMRTQSKMEVDIYREPHQYYINPSISWQATIGSVIVIAAAQMWYFRK